MSRCFCCDYYAGIETRIPTDKILCEKCLEMLKARSITTVEYCEPCAKLDASMVDAIEQIDDTWVCKRCAHAIRFMKERERIEIEIFIRSGKCPF